MYNQIDAYNQFATDGPFGGNGGGNPWDFNVPSSISEIHIRSSACVDSIQFVYMNDENNEEFTPKYGGNGGNLNMFKFTNGEYIRGFSGTYGVYGGSDVITSLSIETQFQTFGPFGSNQGTSFSVTRPRAYVNKFFGNHGQFLDSIGAVFQRLDYLFDNGGQYPIFQGPSGQYPNQGPGQYGNSGQSPQYAKDGPYGANGGGNPWEFKLPGEIRQIHIRSGSIIDSIKFVCKDDMNRDQHSQVFGGNSGNLQMVALANDEYIIGFSGTTGTYMGSNVITSLSFKTKYQTFGPFGRNEGTSFSTYRPRAKVTKFFGSQGRFLESIGAVFLRVDYSNNNNGGQYGNQNIINNGGVGQYSNAGQGAQYGNQNPNAGPGGQFGNQMVINNGGVGQYANAGQGGQYGNQNRQGGQYGNQYPNAGQGGQYGNQNPNARSGGEYGKDGPFGNGEGNPWEFKLPSDIHKIHVRCGTIVDSVRFIYKDEINRDRYTDIFGGMGGNLQTVTLDNGEYIIGFSGTYGDFQGKNVITSLSFETPYRTFGPFGVIEGTSFSTHRPRAKVTKFFGSHGEYLNSIGAVFLRIK